MHLIKSYRWGLMKHPVYGKPVLMKDIIYDKLIIRYTGCFISPHL
jgi:hypothetical protein